jgi:hypothetical protein
LCWKVPGAITKGSVMARSTMSIQVGISKLYKEGRRRETGHYKSEGAIIEPSGSRAVNSKVSIHFEGLSVPFTF